MYALLSNRLHAVRIDIPSAWSLEWRLCHDDAYLQPVCIAQAFHRKGKGIMADIAVKVDRCALEGGDVRPLSFSIGERSFAVLEVSDRWYGERYDYFELMADDGYEYILRHDRGVDMWSLVMMEKAELRG